jgi:hypothetical protein
MSNKLVVVTGIAKIDRRLKTLLPRLQKKVIRQGMRKGLKLIQADAKARWGRETGETIRNIRVRAVKGRKRGSISLEARIKTSDKLVKVSATGKRTFYPAVVEYKKKHWFKQTYDSKKGAARQVAIAEIAAGIEREASKD